MLEIPLQTLKYTDSPPQLHLNREKTLRKQVLVLIRVTLGHMEWGEVATSWTTKVPGTCSRLLW